jgi:hypothetical protein
MDLVAFVGSDFSLLRYLTLSGGPSFQSQVIVRFGVNNFVLNWIADTGMPPMGVPPYGGGYNMEWHGPPMHPHAGPFGYGEGMHGPGPGPMPFDRPMMPGPGYGGPPFGMPPMYPGVPHHGYVFQLFFGVSLSCYTRSAKSSLVM